MPGRYCGLDGLARSTAAATLEASKSHHSNVRIMRGRGSKKSSQAGFKSNTMRLPATAAWLVPNHIKRMTTPQPPMRKTAARHGSSDQKPDLNLRRARISSSAASAEDRKSTRLNSSHVANSYAVFCL